MQLKQAGVDPARITGYDWEETTHTGVARAVAEGRATAGLGIQAAAGAYGLEFVRLGEERYDLVVPASGGDEAPSKRCARWSARRRSRRLSPRSAAMKSPDRGRDPARVRRPSESNEEIWSRSAQCLRSTGGRCSYSTAATSPTGPSTPCRRRSPPPTGFPPTLSTGSARWSSRSWRSITPAR